MRFLGVRTVPLRYLRRAPVGCAQHVLTSPTLLKTCETTIWFHFMESMLEDCEAEGAEIFLK